MNKYLAFLRGINVGGRIIKMAELRACLEMAGFENVATLLQTGNVSFESHKKAAELKPEIEALLSKTFNYAAKVWVISADELRQIVEANPFDGAPSDYHQYVIFFENGLEKEFVAEVQEAKGEKTKAGKGVVYWKVKRGVTLQSQRGKLLTKAKYKNFNTNRNINTLKKIVA
jgi:uncharacterized protein (DUF1697 family)